MSSVPTPLFAPAHSEAERSALSAPERAQREADALYAERGGEFLSYAVALGKNEELARDAIQEAFMRFFVARSEGTEISSPRPWIYRVIHNYILDCMRRERFLHGEALRQLAADGPDIERDCLRREVFSLVRRLLSPREYDCFRLRTEGLGYEEIATRLELKSGTVGALISRAMRKLRPLRGSRP